MTFDTYNPYERLMGVAIFYVAWFNLQFPAVGLMSVVGVFYYSPSVIALV